MSRDEFESSTDETVAPAAWNVMELVFLGFNSRVIAMSRDTGEVAWEWKSPKGRGAYVAVLLDGDMLIVSVQGYTYGLHPETGHQLWANPLKRRGLGIPTLVSMRGNSGSAGAAALLAQQQAAAAAGGAGAAG